jgi:hypothetical protein
MGRTTVFIAEVKDVNMFGEPHFETKETVWLTPSEFNEQGRDLHKPVVKAAVRLIEDSDSNLDRLNVDYSKLEEQSASEAKLANWTRWFTRSVGVDQLFESPQLTSSYDQNDGLNDDKYNKSVADLIIKQHPNITDTITHSDEGVVCIVDVEQRKVVYRSMHDIEPTSDSLNLGRPYSVQTEVWRDVGDTRTRGIATEILFNHILPITGTILCDGLHTPEAKKYWLNVLKLSFDKPAVFVYSVDITSGETTEIPHHGLLRSMERELWTGVDNETGQNKRVLITTKKFK